MVDPEVIALDDPETIALDDPEVMVDDLVSEDEDVVSVRVSMTTSELELECSTWDISDEVVTIISPFMMTCASPLS